MTDLYAYPHKLPLILLTLVEFVSLCLPLQLFTGSAALQGGNPDNGGVKKNTHTFCSDSNPLALSLFITLTHKELVSVPLSPHKLKK